MNKALINVLMMLGTLAFFYGLLWLVYFVETAIV